MNPPDPNDCCVLVVDDIAQNLLAMEALLTRPGVRVLKAQGGAQALELLLVHDVALALLDVQMPEMDGFALAELMRGTERTRSVPIIFLTAASEDHRRSFRGYEAGAVDFLYKPVEPQVLHNKVGIFVELCHQRQQLQERMAELERVVKLNEMMTAVLTHDLRTPVSAIALSAELVERKGHDEAMRRAGSRIKASSRRMARMIDQLLDYSRIRWGVMPVHRQPANLQTVAESAIAEVALARPDASVTLEAEGALDAEFDADRIMQVFINLISNAAQHGTAGQPIAVQLDGCDPARLLARVRNAGALPAKVQATLFEPFRDTARGESGGLGLGLYIVDQFVRAHGGSVTGRAEGDDGTVFEFSLPRHAAA